jgi:hypothetical protein
VQTIPKRLADVRARIAETQRRLAELENSALDHGMTAMLTDSVAVTLKLLREYEARLESRLVPVKAVGNRWCGSSSDGKPSPAISLHTSVTHV